MLTGVELMDYQKIKELFEFIEFAKLIKNNYFESMGGKFVNWNDFKIRLQVGIEY